MVTSSTRANLVNLPTPNGEYEIIVMAGNASGYSDRSKSLYVKAGLRPSRVTSDWFRARNSFDTGRLEEPNVAVDHHH
jgi:hypothetical protein